MVLPALSPGSGEPALLSGAPAAFPGEEESGLLGSGDVQGLGCRYAHGETRGGGPDCSHQLSAFQPAKSSNFPRHPGGGPCLLK